MNYMKTIYPGLASLALSLLAACGGSSGGTVDVTKAAAGGGCETATAALLGENETMLPGRLCGNCHRAGGQAAEEIWTVSGTVYSNPATTTCNSGGVSGAKVEILNAAGAVQFTLTTNSAGNFYSKQAVTFPMRARVTANGKTLEMATAQTSGNCASCHQVPSTGGAPGRVYIQ